MSFEKVDIPKEMDVPVMGTMSRGDLGHMVANGIPLGLAFPLDITASEWEKEDIHERILQISAKPMARMLRENGIVNTAGGEVTEEDLLAEGGKQLVEDHLFILKEKAPAIYEEWMNAEDIATKTADFAGNNIAQWGITAAMLASGVGTIPAMAAGMASGFATTPLVSEFIGKHEKLTPSMIVPIIHQLALKDVNESANLDKTTATIDQPTVAALIISSNPEQFADENGPGLVKEFQAYIENPSPNSELAAHVTDMNGAFTDYLINIIKQNGKKTEQQAQEEAFALIGHGTALEVISKNIQSQDDIGDIMFKPEAFVHKMKMGHMTELAATTKGPRNPAELAAQIEGKGLLHGIQDVQSPPSANALASIPTKPKSPRGGPEGMST